MGRKTPHLFQLLLLRLLEVSRHPTHARQWGASNTIPKLTAHAVWTAWITRIAAQTLKSSANLSYLLKTDLSDPTNPFPGILSPTHPIGIGTLAARVGIQSAKIVRTGIRMTPTVRLGIRNPTVRMGIPTYPVDLNPPTKPEQSLTDWLQCRALRFAHLVADEAMGHLIGDGR